MIPQEQQREVVATEMAQTRTPLFIHFISIIFPEHVQPYPIGTVSYRLRQTMRVVNCVTQFTSNRRIVVHTLLYQHHSKSILFITRVTFRMKLPFNLFLNETQPLLASHRIMT